MNADDDGRDEDFRLNPDFDDLMLCQALAAKRAGHWRLALERLKDGDPSMLLARLRLGYPMTAEAVDELANLFSAAPADRAGCRITIEPSVERRARNGKQWSIDRMREMEVTIERATPKREGKEYRTLSKDDAVQNVAGRLKVTDRAVYDSLKRMRNARKDQSSER